MSNAQPWNTKGVGFDAREAAREAARLQGKSLGEWLHGVIAGEGDEGTPSRPIEGQARIDAVTARLEQLGTRAGDTARRASRTRFDPRVAVRRASDDHHHVEDDDFEEALRGHGRRSHRPARGHDLDDASVVSAIATLEERALRTERRTGQALASMARLLEETQARRDREYGDVAALTRKLGDLEADLSHRFAMGNDNPIKGSLARLEARLDTIGRRGVAEAAVRQNFTGRAAEGGEPMRRLEEKMNVILDAVQPHRGAGTSSAAIAAAQAAPPAGRRSLGEAIAEISRRQRLLEDPEAANDDGSMAQAQSPLGVRREESEEDLVAILRAEMANLAAKVDDIRRDTAIALQEQPSRDGELAALRAEVGALTRTLEGWVPQGSVETLEGSIATLSDRIVVSREQGVHENALQPIEAAVGELRDALHALDPRQTIVGLEEELHRIGDKVDGLAAHDRSGIDRLQEQVEELRASVTGVAAFPLPFDRIEQQVALLVERLDLMDHGRGRTSEDADTGPLEHLVRELGEKFEAAQSFGAEGGTLEALQRQIERLSERLERSEAGLSTLPSLAATMRDLFAQFDNPRATDQTASGAGSSGATSRDADRQDREAGLAAVRAVQDEIETRTSTALNTVRDVLGKVVERLAAMEHEIADVRKGPAHQGDGSAKDVGDQPPALFKLPAASRLTDDDREIRLGGMEPRVETARAKASRKNEATPTKSDQPEATSTGGRADFIAAARRAAAAAQAEAFTAERLVSMDKGARAGLLTRSRDYVATHKRPMLMSMGAIMMALGALALASRLGVGMSGNPELAALPVAPTKIASAAPPARAGTPKPDDATKAIATASNNTDPIQTGSIPSLPSFAAGMAMQPRPVLPKALLAAAEGGNVAAQYDLAIRFADGRLVARDMRMAASWFEKAAEAGSAPAQYRLASLYEKGIGVVIDKGRAKTLYTKAASAGNPRAMHNLAVMLADGDGHPDYAGAMDWFRKAAEYGVHDSQYNLAVLLGRGLGTSQNLVQSYQWFAVAAAANDADAEKKRGEVEEKLSASDLAVAKALAASFKPKTPDPAAVEVASPPGGWDSVPGASRLNSPRSKISSL